VSHSRFEELLGLLLDDRIAAAQLDELHQLVQSQPALLHELQTQLQLADLLSQYEDETRCEANFLSALETRRQATNDDGFVQRVMSAVQREANTDQIQTLEKNTPTAGQALTQDLWKWVGMWVAVAASVVVGMWWWNVPQEQVADGKAVIEPVDDGVAVITRTVGATWLEGQSFQVGDTLAPLTLNLAAGIVQLEFYSGASVILEGPAQFEIININKAVCQFGKVRAMVPPPAQGFVIMAPTVELVDLGTEFGLDVDTTGQTSVHVFTGRVEVYDADTNRAVASRRELLAGDGLTIDPQGQVQAMAVEDNAFMTASRMDGLEAAEHERQLQRWRAMSDTIRRDPRVVAYYSFERHAEAERTLWSHAPNSGLEGAIVGCSWTPGRWPGKTALEFKRPSDRVRLHISEELNSLTFAAWVRVDGLDRQFNTLMLTDGYDVGEPHWQIDRAGRLVLGVHHEERVQHNYTSAPIFDLKRLGQWVHLATVYDSAERHAQHYLNGQLIHDEKLKRLTPIRIGDAEIGNWGRPIGPTHMAIRNFNGRMDEFSLYRVALTAAEIQQLFLAGQP